MLSRKHYKLLAAALREAREHTHYDGCPLTAIEEIVDRLVEVLAADNPRFNEAKFRQACEYAGKPETWMGGGV